MSKRHKVPKGQQARQMAKDGVDPGMTAKDRNAIKGAIRQTFKYSLLHSVVMQAGRVETVFNNRKRVFYRCQLCEDLFEANEIEIDHIEEVGQFEGSFDQWIARVWCSIKNLQRLCKDCHLSKTNDYREGLNAERYL